MWQTIYYTTLNHNLSQAIVSLFPHTLLQKYVHNMSFLEKLVCEKWYHLMQAIIESNILSHTVTFRTLHYYCLLAKVMLNSRMICNLHITQVQNIFASILPCLNYAKSFESLKPNGANKIFFGQYLGTSQLCFLFAFMARWTKKCDMYIFWRCLFIKKCYLNEKT